MKAFLVGLGLGALVGVAYAPRAGSETRRDLEERARQSLDGANERVDAIRERLSSARSRVTSAAQEMKRGVQSMGQPGSGTGKERHAKASGAGSGRSTLLTIINDWPEERLIAIHGIGPVLASKIIRNRPYEQEEDLVESKELPPSAIEALRRAS
jgi:DNA uptake protein ComE-like DNA-binding protein